MDKYFTLYNGVRIPQIGFGTFRSTDVNGREVIIEALRQGYRHLDTAAFYFNEREIAQAVGEAGISRQELFLTSKVWKEELGYDNTLRAFEKSLDNLGTDYLDLYLIHWPIFDLTSDSWRELDRETWKAMERLYEEGSIKAIGVSNFLPHHLMNIAAKANHKPMVDQLEYHPGYTQQAAVDYCQANGILVEAWSPLGRTRVMNEPLLIEMSEKYGKSVAQICLGFALQNGILPLPKSSSAERMKANLDVYDFEISEEDMYRILTLPQIGWSGEHPDRERIRI